VLIADISDAKSVLQELLEIVPNSPKLPVQPIIVAGQKESGMLDHLKAYPWFLKVYSYDTSDQLLGQNLDQLVALVEAEVARRA
jgi:hypothetical protein